MIQASKKGFALPISHAPLSDRRETVQVVVFHSLMKRPENQLYTGDAYTWTLGIGLERKTLIMLIFHSTLNVLFIKIKK